MPEGNVQVFELYDITNGSLETHREMTDRAADLRNGDLREKQDTRRWVVCDCSYPYIVTGFSENEE